MASKQNSERQTKPAVKRGLHAGVIARLMLVLFLLVVIITLGYQYRGYLPADLLMAALGIFAVFGVFFILSALLGLIKFFPGERGNIFAEPFLDNYPDAVLVTDNRDRIVYANAAYSRLAGHHSSGMPPGLGELFAGEPESAEVVYRLTQMVRGGQDSQEEFRLSKPLSGKGGESGDWYRLRARFAAIADGRGRKRNYHVWQISDLTGERQEQEHYFKELQKAIDYLDHAPVGFLTCGADGTVRYLNATLAGWLDIDLATFATGSIALSDLVASEDMALLTALEAGAAQRATESFNVSMRLPSGRYLPVRILHDVSASREGMPGESRTVVLKAGDAPDQPVEEAPQERLFNDTPMAIATIDRDGRLLNVNTRFMTMFADVMRSEDLAAGMHIASLIDEVGRTRMEEALQAAADHQGDIPPFEARHVGDDGRHFRFFVHAARSAEASALVYAIDISEQRALEAQMARTQKLNAVGTLAGGIAHDFNNVLTAILLSADHLLLQSRASDPEFADLVEIKRNANRASQLVRQLLAFSRQQTMRPQVVDLTDVVGEHRMMMERLTGGGDIRLTTEFQRDLWPVKTDPGQFGQVITNLCVNARDAMPDGGTLTVKTRNVPADDVPALGIRELPERDYVMVEVADTGTGIPPDVLDKIFEPFFTTKDVGKGTGLGLAMVYGIITQSGGYLHPVSEVGKGTRFLILLPRHEHGSAAGGAETGAPKDHKGQPIAAAFSEANEADNDAPREEDMDLTGQSCVVLLVEDEDAVRRSSKRMLEMRGFTVHDADTGVHALSVLEKLGGTIDIVVSDVVMPEMDGPTLLREARKEYPDLKFIFVSGYADDAFAKNLPDDAKFGFLPKPYNLKQLVAAVWEMLREG